ncbi:MAG TPA: hypothetical protein VNU21_18255 [Usitatibacter sp.]|jgi:hypothetical protein|nr:hypothetical protein [Usitatibacter sp.]
MRREELWDRIAFHVVEPIGLAHESAVFNRTVTLRDSWAKA